MERQKIGTIFWKVVYFCTALWRKRKLSVCLSDRVMMEVVCCAIVTVCHVAQTCAFIGAKTINELQVFAPGRAKPDKMSPRPREEDREIHTIHLLLSIHPAGADVVIWTFISIFLATDLMQFVTLI